MSGTALPPRYDVVGTPISATNLDETVAAILDPPARGLVVAICTVHSVMTARRDPVVRRDLEAADIATPDGVPLTWALRLTHAPGQPQVDGYRVFLRTVEVGLGRGVGHFLYGATPETLDALRAELRRRYPGVRVAGAIAPPFRPLTEDERRAHLGAVRDSGASVVWVGLGMPKQERWMQDARGELPGISLVGIGAVFDWVAGNVPKAPEWMQRAGLEWTYRLMREPRRLWRRYLWNNPTYLALLAAQVARHRRRRGR